jgi:putative mRNA 3-end processing factor
VTTEARKLKEMPYVSGKGTIVMSDSVVVDGYRPNFKCRVQSHVHDDHMNNFQRSKTAKIICSPATKDLLILEYPEMAIHANLISVDNESPFEIGDSEITLYGSNHMLGSVQVTVLSKNHGKVGYSGDFGWPLNQIPKVDRLVLDCTYGSLQSKSLPSRQTMIENVVDFVRTKSTIGPVYLHGFRGAYNQVLATLVQSIDIPILCSDYRKKELSVYRKYGYLDGNATAESDVDYDKIKATGRYVQLVGKNDPRPDENDTKVCQIYLRAFYGRQFNPITQLADNVFEVLYSDHADFEKTLEYVEATGATFIMTDSFRGQESAKQVARYINLELGVKAVASSPDSYDLD